MQLDRRRLKAEARQAMRAHRPSVYLVTLAFLIIGYILTLLSSRLMRPGLDTQKLENEALAYFQSEYSPDMSQAEQEALLETMTARMTEGLLRQLEERPGLAGYLLITALGIMNLMIGIGYASFCLNAARGAAAGFGALFDGFTNFFRLLWLGVVTGVFLFLWSLLLVVPGIIAAYRYSMAFFIQLDHPDKGALQCLRESREMTRGHKWQLFVLDLSFLGWMLLGMIPFVSVFTDPYMTITRAQYYRVLSGQMEPPVHIDYSV